jgi:hypothetical protein
MVQGGSKVMGEVAREQGHAGRRVLNGEADADLIFRSSFFISDDDVIP